MSVTYWVFDNEGVNKYTFPRNPDRRGGDTGWVHEPKMNILSISGANHPTIQMDGFEASRTVKFTAIHGNMMRTLKNFYLASAVVDNCRDHLYPTTAEFSCVITSFSSALHPTLGTFPGSYEDTYDVEMTIMKMS